MFARGKVIEKGNWASLPVSTRLVFQNENSIAFAKTKETSLLSESKNTTSFNILKSED